MNVVRCPKHDVLFQTVSDHRFPGAPANQKQPAHPENCHPDCPNKNLGVEQAVSTKTKIS